MKLQEFNKKYKYQSDKERFNTSLDIWELPKDNDIIYGDCESYARFLRNNISEFEDWDYYYCKLNGIGHCVLSNGAMIIDCNTQKVVSYSEYCRRYKVTEFKKYNWFVVFSKILFSKAYIWIYSLKN